MNHRMPAMQPKMVTVMDRKDMIVCPADGGVGLIFNAAFMPKHNLAAIGSKPEIVPVVMVLCSICGKPLEPPFTRLEEVKEQ